MKQIYQDSCVGGIPDGSKKGYSYNKNPASYADGIGVDFRTDADKITALNKLKDSSITVTGLPTAIKKITNYTETFGDVLAIATDTELIVDSLDNANSTGIAAPDYTPYDIEWFNDKLWWTSSGGLGCEARNGVFVEQILRPQVYEKDDDYYDATTANTYAIPTSISEADADKFTITADYHEYDGVGLYVAAKSTGDLTVTMHDNANRVVANVTIANADILTTGYAKLYFDTIARTSPTFSYHIHVTATASGATLNYADTANDLRETRMAVYKNTPTELLDSSSVITVADSQESRAATSITLDEYDENDYEPEEIIKELDDTDWLELTPTTNFISGIAILSNTNGAPANQRYGVILVDANKEYITSTTFANVAPLGLTGGVDMEDSFKAYTLIPIVSTNQRGAVTSNGIKVKASGTYYAYIFSYDGAGSGTVTPAILGSSTTVSTAYYKLYTSDLTSSGLSTSVESRQFTPLKEFLNLLCVGAGNKIITVDDSGIVDKEAVVFPVDETVRCLEDTGDYIAVGTTRGTDLGDYGTSRVYFWNGVDDTYDFYIKVVGQIQAIKNDGNNRLYMLHGEDLVLSVYYLAPTLYSSGVVSLRKLKDVPLNKSIEVLPNAAAMWLNSLSFGISDGSDTTVDRVIYSLGREHKDLPIALSKDFKVSTGTIDDDVKIGSILACSGSEMYVGYEDDDSFYIDQIDTANDNSEVTIQTLRIDGNLPHLQKVAKTFVVRCDPLTANQSIDVKYRIDGNGSFTALGSLDTTDQIYESFPLPVTDCRFFEIEFQVILKYSSGTDAPTVIGWALSYDENDKFQLGTITA